METKDPPQDKNFKVKSKYCNGRFVWIRCNFPCILLHSVLFIASSKWLAWWKRINSILKVLRSKSRRICLQTPRKDFYPVWIIAWNGSHGLRMAAIMLCCKLKILVWHISARSQKSENETLPWVFSSFVLKQLNELGRFWKNFHLKKFKPNIPFIPFCCEFMFQILLFLLLVWLCAWKRNSLVSLFKSLETISNQV